MVQFFKTAQARALVGHGYTWQIERFGLVVLTEYDMNGAHHTLAEAPPTPYRLHARVDHGPCLFMDVIPGESPIWEHRVTDSVSIYSSYRVTTESIIFGKREANGGEIVARVYQDGSAFEFTSLNAARAHQFRTV